MSSPTESREYIFIFLNKKPTFVIPMLLPYMKTICSDIVFSFVESSKTMTLQWGKMTGSDNYQEKIEVINNEVFNFFQGEKKVLFYSYEGQDVKFLFNSESSRISERKLSEIDMNRLYKGFIEKRQSLREDTYKIRNFLSYFYREYFKKRSKHFPKQLHGNYFRVSEKFTDLGGRARGKLVDFRENGIMFFMALSGYNHADVLHETNHLFYLNDKESGGTEPVSGFFTHEAWDKIISAIGSKRQQEKESDLRNKFIEFYRQQKIALLFFNSEIDDNKRESLDSDIDTFDKYKDFEQYIEYMKNNPLFHNEEFKKYIKDKKQIFLTDVAFLQNIFHDKLKISISGGTHEFKLKEDEFWYQSWARGMYYLHFKNSEETIPKNESVTFNVNDDAILGVKSLYNKTKPYAEKVLNMHKSIPNLTKLTRRGVYSGYRKIYKGFSWLSRKLGSAKYSGGSRNRGGATESTEDMPKRLQKQRLLFFIYMTMYDERYEGFDLQNHVRKFEELFTTNEETDWRQYHDQRTMIFGADKRVYRSIQVASEMVLENPNRQNTNSGRAIPNEEHRKPVEFQLMYGFITHSFWTPMRGSYYMYIYVDRKSLFEFMAAHVDIFEPIRLLVGYERIDKKSLNLNPSDRYLNYLIENNHSIIVYFKPTYGKTTSSSFRKSRSSEEKASSAGGTNSQQAEAAGEKIQQINTKFPGMFQNSIYLISIHESELYFNYIGNKLNERNVLDNLGDDGAIKHSHYMNHRIIEYFQTNLFKSFEEFESPFYPSDTKQYDIYLNFLHQYFKLSYATIANLSRLLRAKMCRSTDRDKKCLSK